MGIDWVSIAKMDWEVYHDENRILTYVTKGKITMDEAYTIMGK